MFHVRQAIARLVDELALMNNARGTARLVVTDAGEDLVDRPAEHGVGEGGRRQQYHRHPPKWVESIFTLL